MSLSAVKLGIWFLVYLLAIGLLSWMGSFGAMIVRSPEAAADANLL
ncbi:MAG: hypothetical protein ACLQHS_12725 [Candidatus Limnocylindrales bacterium]